MKKVCILATGGTIAGSSDSGTNSEYKAGTRHIAELIDAVPEIKNLAKLQAEQIANIDSKDMKDEIWLKLAKRINEILADDEICGVVITQGTDTMEESAYFLNLVINSDKPVVLTGAMRNPSSLSSDGELNLYNAISVAIDENAKNMGVMVVMNDEIHSAREVCKANTTALNAFASPSSGKIGVVYYGDVKFYLKPLRIHTQNSIFSQNLPSFLPRVDIIYTHAGICADNINHEARGLIIASAGNGGIHENLANALESTKQNGVAVVLSSRSGSGVVSQKANFISADNLNPQKARILLSLCLAKGLNFAQICEIFSAY